MTTKIGDLYFVVSAQTTQARKDVQDYLKKVTDTTTAAGAAVARAIGQTIASATAVATVGVFGLATATVNAGVAYNVLGQSATAAFSSIYDDANAAYEILQGISRLDLETPFESRALISVARTLAGFGVARDDIVSLTASLSEATAAMGLGSDAVHRMAIAFGQIQSRGKLAGDEARQLANYGIDAYGLLAERMGLSVAAVRELGQQSKLTADFVLPTLAAAIETRFGGAIERMTNTAAGQAEVLGSAFRAIGSALVQPFIGFSTGGAIVTAMKAIQREVGGMVEVAEDGSFRLVGALAPLTPIMEGLAASVAGAGEAIGAALGRLDGFQVARMLQELGEIAPVIAGVGAGLTAMVARSIPLLGTLVAGFNPIVVGVTALMLTSDKLRESLGDALRRIGAALKPLAPDVQELVKNFLGLAEEAIPELLDAVVISFEALAPALEATVAAANDLLPVIGPILVTALQAVALAARALSKILDVLGSDFVAVTGVLYGLSILLPTVTARLAIMTVAAGASGTAAALAATKWGFFATAIATALAAIGSYNSIKAGLSGDLDYLNRDVPIWEKPFQLAGRGGFALFGGDRGQVAQTAEQNRLLEEGEAAGLAYAEAMATSGLSMSDFSETVRTAGLSVEAINFALLEYRGILDEISAKQREWDGASLFEKRLSDSYARNAALAQQNLLIDEEIDLLGQLRDAATLAWAAVDRLARAGAGSTIDDFFRELPSLATQLTAALDDVPGVLRDLEVGGVLGDVRAQALSVIRSLAQEYGMSVREVKAALGERGLAGVIEALGKMTEETTEAVDPLVAKYASLGATAEQLRAAITKLNDARQTTIRSQIDQVEAALVGARRAALDAREAVSDFLSGGYLNSPQQLVDNLIGDVDGIGSRIEDALRLGGVRGEAAVRSAYGDLQEQLTSIVNSGIASGLSGQELVDMLSPVLTAIREEVGTAANRISSLDWTEGISGPAGQRISEALLAGMDAEGIQRLISDILGAESNVTGLERQLQDLQAQLQADVEFSPAQVQGALDEIRATTKVTPVVTPEAAQLVYDEIQAVFEDTELMTAVDKAIITQQILDAAQDAENQVNLLFTSGLSFDSALLRDVAKQVSDEFYSAFNQRLRELADQRAQEAGFANVYEMQRALGPAVTAAMTGTMVFTTNVNNDITIDGAQTPIATADEVIAASSAAAGSGGRFDPSKYNRDQYYVTMPGGNRIG